MKKYLIIGILSIALFSCSKNNRGDLVGVSSGKKWVNIPSEGMTLIPTGSFTMGTADYDVASSNSAPSKTVSISAFYMDETEISNSEYKQFVHWVRDSILRERLAFRAYNNIKDKKRGNPEYMGSGNGVEYYKYIEADLTDVNSYNYYLDSLQNTVLVDTDSVRPWGRKLDWSKELNWNYSDNGLAREYRDILLSMFNVVNFHYEGGQTAFTKTQIILDTKQLIFHDEAKAKDYLRRNYKGSNDSVVTVDMEKIRANIAVYPDTTVWKSDFTYSFNEPMEDHYFSHKAFDNYPVVGVNFYQAQAFCSWRTKIKNDYLKSKGENLVSSFRLPTEAEWEYAARGGLEFATYPWGGPYAYDDRGCFMANFKPMRGNYTEDNALYTVPVDAYYPNDYGLYNMAGNVSEWTSSAYNSNPIIPTINPDIKDESTALKVVRGGSWKDVAYFLEVGTRDSEYADSARTYIGFRTVQSYLGNDLSDNN